MKKSKGAKIWLGIGIALLLFYIGGIFYFHCIHVYSPLGSAGKETDTFIHSLFVLPPTVISFAVSAILHNGSKK